METLVGLIVLLTFQSGIYGKMNVAMTEDEKLEAIEEQLFEHVLQEYPEFATVTGSDAHDHKLTSYTQEAFQRRKIANEKMVADLESLTQNKLSNQHKIRYTILMDHIQTFLRGYRWREFGTLNPINIMESLYSKSSSWFLPKDELREHFRRYRGRFESYPQQAHDYFLMWILKIFVIDDDRAFGESRPADTPLTQSYYHGVCPNSTLSGRTLGQILEKSAGQDPYHVTFKVPDYNSGTYARRPPS
ncbi:uncharacterized protein [Argopecten irradians]|uniref:uncharacterized protein n=1 Tax=Argopecten irradians TaxID=31199 RepID=UPI0037144A01